MTVGLLALLLAAAAAPATARATWRWPVRGEVVRPFATVADRFAAGQHRGIDVAAAPGTPVRAACSGRVRFVGHVGDSGLTVSTRCGPLLASYLHLASAAVRRGARVAAGDVLGRSGRSGAPRGRTAHLHLGAREAATGHYVDPVSLLGGDPAAPPLLPPRARGVPRAVPLGPAPRPAPVPRAVPFRPAPHPSPRPALASRPAPHPLPWAAWAGLLCLAAALPLGGLVARRRTARRRGAEGGAARATPAGAAG